MEVIDKAIIPKKQTQWHWRIHPYFTKQASNVVAEYIKRFSKVGDIVLDPFCGTGVTQIESLVNRRRTIGVDISPLSVFLTRETCFSPIDINLFDIEFKKLEKVLSPLIELVRNSDDKKISNYKITDWYPKGVKLPSNSDFEFVEDLFDKKQLIVYSKLLSCIKKIKDEEIKKLFLLVFSSTISRVNLTYWLSNTRGQNRMGDGGPSIFGAYRYAKPTNTVSLDVWDAFERRYYGIKKAKVESNKLIGNHFKESKKDFFKEKATFQVLKESATNLTKFIPENSIDYIYTDPPYGAHIAYLDLSTMWNAWLEFDVSKEDKKLEAIEGGDLKKSKDDYIDLIYQSIEEMAKVLKQGAYMSLVFQHKDVAYWNMIQEACNKAGFSYVNTVYQPTNTTSIHKKKNPLMVMGSQLILNFKKTKKIKSGIKLREETDIEKIILDTAERVIVDEGGTATTEDIYAEVVPSLLEAGLLHIANKQYSQLIPLLQNNFELDTNGYWQIKKGSTLGQHIDKKKKIEYFIKSSLKKNSITLDEIIANVMPNLTNGSTPTKKELLEVVQEIAEPDGDRWKLKKEEINRPFDFKEQKKLDLFINKPETEHNKIIYHLCLLAEKIGLTPYVGKQEQRDSVLVDLNMISKLPIKMSDFQKKRIEQIDCIWFYNDGTPAYAFEVEEHTSIMSGLERFSSLLEVDSNIGNKRRLLVIIPKSRKKKAEQELTKSTYIGHPTYLERKLEYIFKEEFLDRIKDILSKKKIKIEDIDTLGHDISTFGI